MSVLVLALVWTSCGGDEGPPTPTTPSTPTPVVTRVSVAGNLALTGVGETSQLTATATLSDGTTMNVTNTGSWTTTDDGVATVSPAGLVTAVHLGAAYMNFTQTFPVVGSRSSRVLVTATPPGTFVILGDVREPGMGPVSGARVADTATGTFVITKSGGFSLGGLLRLPAQLKVEKDAYEPVEMEGTGTDVDVPIQRMIRLIAGETVKPAPLANNDLSYEVGGKRCEDCRLIRVVVSRAGVVHVHVSWTTTAVLSLFAAGQMVAGEAGDLSADVPVGAPGEVVMYFGGAQQTGLGKHTPFTFETSLR